MDENGYPVPVNEKCTCLWELFGYTTPSRLPWKIGYQDKSILLKADICEKVSGSYDYDRKLPHASGVSRYIMVKHKVFKEVFPFPPVSETDGTIDSFLYNFLFFIR